MDFTKKICSEKGVTYRFDYTTNAYLLNHSIISQMINYQPINFQITLDGCEEHHNKTRFLRNGIGTYRKIIENIKLLVNNNFDVLIRLNYTHENIERLPEIIYDIESLKDKANVSVAFERVWQDYQYGNMKSMFEKSKEQFRKSGFIIDEINYRATPKWCYGNRQNAAIVNYNGDIFKCTARDFTTSSREGYLSDNGSIIWNSEKVNKRRQALFENMMCYDCRVAPLCTEICSQKALDEGDNVKCVFTEDEKNDLILTRFYSAIIEKEKQFIQ